jgi:hypothetical protein
LPVAGARAEKPEVGLDGLDAHTEIRLELFQAFQNLREGETGAPPGAVSQTIARTRTEKSLRENKPTRIIRDNDQEWETIRQFALEAVPAAATPSQLCQGMKAIDQFALERNWQVSWGYTMEPDPRERRSCAGSSQETEAIWSPLCLENEQKKRRTGSVTELGSDNEGVEGVDGGAGLQPTAKRRRRVRKLRQ